MRDGLGRGAGFLLDRLDDMFDRLRARTRNDLFLAAFLLLPASAVLAVFGVFPLFFAFYLSLFGGRSGAGPFVGLANYAATLASPQFWHSFVVTVYFAVGVIPATMALSFILAWMLFNIARARGFFRTVYFLPYVTSAVAAAMIWRGILNPQYGPANVLLQALGLPPQNWLLEPRGILSILTNDAIPSGVGPSLALCCVILFEIWHSSGFMIVIFLAGLSAIPRELVEAARIDGADTRALVRRVVLPMLSPTIFFLGVVGTIRAFQSFNSFYALTGNGRGPLDSTENLTVYIFTTFYEYQRIGSGATAATILSVAIVGLTVVQWLYFGRRVHYE